MTTTVTTKPTKAIVGSIFTAVTAIAVGLVTIIPNDAVRLTSAIVVLVLGALGSAFGIYQTTNKTK